MKIDGAMNVQCIKVHTVSPRKKLDFTISSTNHISTVDSLHPPSCALFLNDLPLKLLNFLLCIPNLVVEMFSLCILANESKWVLPSLGVFVLRSIPRQDPLNQNIIDPPIPSTLKADFASHLKGFDYLGW